jgi:hypothetical protein
MPPKKRNAGGRGSRGSPAKGPTVASCLAALGVDDPKAAFSDAPNLDEQFKIVKRFYHRWAFARSSVGVRSKANVDRIDRTGASADR